MKAHSATDTLSRRRFFRSGLLGTTGLVAAAALPPSSLLAGPTKTPRDNFNGLKFGMASYTLRSFDLDHAIAMTKQVGVKYICLKDMHLPLKSDEAQCQEAARKIEAAGLVLVGGGVIYMKNAAEVQNSFAYAKRAGMRSITCSPDPTVLDLVETAAKEHDILVAIHNHGPTDKKYPSPRDVLRLVKDRDPRMGICMDVGHTVRIGEDPVEVIHDCGKRLLDFHFKDVTTATASGKPTEVGQGIIDIVGVLKALKELNYAHYVNLEYEANGDNPMPGVIESYAFIRGALAAI